MSLDDLQVFFQAAHLGSLSQAANVLNMNISSISRRIKNLEDASGVKLMIRHSRGISLTDAGEQVFLHAKIIFNETQKLTSTISDFKEHPEKRLRLSAPEDIINTWVIPNLKIFKNTEYQPSIEITASSSIGELVSNLPDLELTFESTRRADFIERPVGSFDLRLFGSTVYLERKGLSSKITDPEHYDFITFTDHSDFFHMNSAMPYPENTSDDRRMNCLKVTTLSEMFTAINTHNGIGPLPNWVNGKGLERLNTSQRRTQTQSVAMFLSYPAHLRDSAKVNACKELIISHLKHSNLAKPNHKKTATKQDYITVCSLFSQTGLMAPWESHLSVLSEKIIEKFNNEGGVLGKKIKLLTPDPKSNWNEYGRLAQTLIDDQVTRFFFGCWTSAARKQVIPSISNRNGILFYPLHFEGNETAEEVVYLNAPPTKSVMPALDYALRERGNVDAFIGIGSDYVWPRTINEISSSYLKAAGMPGSKISYRYYPIGFTDFTDEINSLHKLSLNNAKSIILSISLIGPSLKAFLQLLSETKFDLAFVTIIAFDATDLDTYQLDCSRLQGLLSCWGYFENSTDNPTHERFKTIYASSRKLSKIPIIDPAISTYNAFQLWKNAVEKAQTTEHIDVMNALSNTKIQCPSTDHELRFNTASNILDRPTFLGMLQRDGRFIQHQPGQKE